MFVQALAEFADRALSQQLGDVAFEEKGVQYLIELDQEGRFLNITERLAQDVDPSRKTMKARAVPMLVPRSPVNRNSGHHPLIAVDDISYVLGPGIWTKKPSDSAKEQKHHEAFVELLCRATEATGDAALKACVRFYADGGEVAKARFAMENYKGGIVSLSVNGPVVCRDTVQSYWRSHYERAYAERVARGNKGRQVKKRGTRGRPAGNGQSSFECLISGTIGSIAPTHEPIKGLGNVGGQAKGVALMSFDKPAFRSYGWDQCANSPVSTDRAMAYVLALNHLLTPGGNHRRDFNGVAFIFWTRDQEHFDLFSLLTQPSPAQIQELLNFSQTADPDPNQFYMAALSANGGRLILRSWITETLLEVKTNLAAWFKGVRVQSLTNGKAEAVPFWQLLQAIDREGKPPANRTVALLRRAIEGERQPLGYQMLSSVLTRIRADRSKRLNSAALGLLRLCVNDVRSKGDSPMNEGLDEGNKHPAYLCGRLLAVYESLQYKAFSSAGESKVNVTIADRYYDLASTSPQVAFPKVVELGRKHLRKLRRSNGGIAWAIESQIAGLQQEIELACGFKWPPMLNLDGQGRFALGYYHQKANQFRSKSDGDQSELTKDEESKEQ